QSREKQMQQADLRRQSLDYLYQPTINQQYALNVRGGGGNFNYSLSGGYDRGRSNIIGNLNERMNISVHNAYRLTPNLELNGSIYYTNQREARNGLGYIKTASVYEELVDDNGSPKHISGSYRTDFMLSAPETGLLDWAWRPIDEMKLNDV